MEKCLWCQKSFSARNIPDDVLKCSFCAKYCHAKCHGIEDAGVIKYIRSGAYNLWNCTRCEQKRELLLTFTRNFDEVKNMFSEQQKSMADLADLVRRQGEDLRNMRLEIKNNASRPGTQTVKRSFADVINSQLGALSVPSKKQKTKNSTVQHKKVPKSIDPVIVIQHKQGLNQSVEIQRKIMENFDPDEDPIDSMRATNKNKVVVRCRDESEFATITEKISKVMGEEYSVGKPKESDRILLFYNVPKEWINDQILVEMRANAGLEKYVDHLCVKRTSVNGIVYVQCSDETTYKELLEKKVLRVGWYAIRVRPFVNLRRCYNCQSFDHVAAKCDKEQACAQCGESHDVKVCVAKTKKCINCEREGRSNLDHCTWSSKCPTVQAKMNVRM